MERPKVSRTKNQTKWSKNPSCTTLHNSKDGEAQGGRPYRLEAPKPNKILTQANMEEASKAIIILTQETLLRSVYTLSVFNNQKSNPLEKAKGRGFYTSS